MTNNLWRTMEGRGPMMAWLPEEQYHGRYPALGITIKNLLELYGFDALWMKQWSCWRVFRPHHLSPALEIARQASVADWIQALRHARETHSI